jgi:RNA polymerase sigma factor (sigma-70 family)
VTIFVDNRDLLERFRRGERAALAAVYERYVDEVATLARRGFTIESSGHVYVRGATGDGERELVQDTFVRAFGEKARLAYDGISPYRPYLLRVTKNLMIDRYRAAQKEANHVELDESGVGDLDALLAANRALPSVDDPIDLDWKAQLAATAEYLATLDEESRRIVALRFEDELSQDEVAARVGCTRRRVRSVEARTQDELRVYLRKRGLHRG